MIVIQTLRGMHLLLGKVGVRRLGAIESYSGVSHLGCLFQSMPRGIGLFWGYVERFEGGKNPVRDSRFNPAGEVRHWGR
jgi:hypothetical protein